MSDLAVPSLPPIPEIMISNSDTSIFWKDVFNGKVSNDDPVWKEYVDAAASYDSRMVDEWTKILDVVLVFIALFISVLTAFVIETSTQFERDPAEITNDILIALYNKPASAPAIHISDFSKLDPAKDRKAVVNNTFLFTSLALSVVIAMFSLTAKLWVVRYMHRVNSPGTSYDRAMRRQEAFSGIEAWKLGMAIDTLPLLVLVAVFLFGLFIHSAISDDQDTLGSIVATILLVGLSFLLVGSFSAAFIPSCPYQSSFSDVVRFLFNARKFHNPHGVFQVLIILVVCIGVAVLAIFLAINESPAYQILTYIPIAGVFAVARKPEKSPDYTPWLGVPGFVFFSGTAIFIMISASAYFSGRGHIPTFACISTIGFVMLFIVAICMDRLTRYIPDTREAEAIAWLLKVNSSPSHESSLLKNAGLIAKTPQRKALLLNALIPLLQPLIESHDEHSRGELEIYVSCLAQLSDFQDKKRSLWTNTAPVGHPALPPALMGRLKALGNNPNRNQRLRQAAVAVWQHYNGDESGGIWEKDVGEV